VNDEVLTWLLAHRRWGLAVALLVAWVVAETIAQLVAVRRRKRNSSTGVK